MKRITFVFVSLVAILVFKASLYLDGACTGEGTCLDQLTLASQKGNQLPRDAAADADMELEEGGASEPSSTQPVTAMQNLVDSQEMENKPGQEVESPTEDAVPGIQQTPDELSKPAFETLPQAGSSTQLHTYASSGTAANNLLLSQLGGSGLTLENSPWLSGEFANLLNTSKKQLQKSDRCLHPFVPPKINWTAYFEKVYHQSVPAIPRKAAKKAANEFEWFYYTLFDESSQKQPECMTVFDTENEAHGALGTAWTVKSHVEGLWCSPRCPVNKVPSYGFFIVRPWRTGYDRQSRIEVLHAAYSEGTVSWFYPLKGTGVFINVDKLRALGQVVENQYMGDISKYMYEQNVMVLIRPGLGNGFWMAEIVVRMSLGKGACVLPKEMLSTGFTERLPCVCNKSEEILNCNG